MELPKVLESVMCVLLNSHFVSSWKVAAESRNPTIILRLCPVSENQNGDVNTVAYRRKSSSQMNRDKQRMANFKQRSEAENQRSVDTSSSNQVRQSDNARDSVYVHEEKHTGVTLGDTKQRRR